MDQHKPYGPYEKYLKRPLDCFLAAGALVVLSPVMGITALMVRNKLGTPVIFKQERPGKDEELFILYKFRSMTDAKDEEGELLPDTERLTAFGRMLRRSSLDELPELVNILRGDMAFVGPRPLLKQYLPYYSDRERLRHTVRPGLTGLAQVSGRNLLDWDRRLAFDVEYLQKITFRGDLRIVLLTVKNVLTKKDVAAATEAVETYLNEEREKMKMIQPREGISKA